MNTEGLDKLLEVVPQQYSDAIKIYPWFECEPHEYDNRNTIENSNYIIRGLLKRSNSQ